MVGNAEMQVDDIFAVHRVGDRVCRTGGEVDCAAGTVVEIEAAGHVDRIEQMGVAHAVELIDVTVILIDAGQPNVIGEETIGRRSAELGGEL